MSGIHFNNNNDAEQFWTISLLAFHYFPSHIVPKTRVFAINNIISPQNIHQTASPF